MTPEEKQEFERMKVELANLKSQFFKGDFPDKKVFYKQLVAQGGIDLTGDSVALGSSAGVIGFYAATPVVRAAAIASPSGGATVDTQARTAIDSIRIAIKNIGITL